jgi:hypothetical protein
MGLDLLTFSKIYVVLNICYKGFSALTVKGLSFSEVRQFKVISHCLGLR